MDGEQLDGILEKTSMAQSAESVLRRKISELYWTITRFLGLAHTHHWPTRRSVEAFILWLLAPLVWLCTPFTKVLANNLRRRDIEIIDIPCWQIDRIGHLALDIDCYLKDRVLSGKRGRPVLLVAGCKPNEALLAQWSRYLSIIRNPLLILLLRPLLREPGLSTNLTNYILVGWPIDHRIPTLDERRGCSQVYAVQKNWGARPPLVSLSGDEIAAGQAALRRLGVPAGAWFVCVHNRESGFWSKEDWAHAHRNSSILDYDAAMKAIVARGGWCIRMGDPTMQPLSPEDGVIDYAFSAEKSDAMDLFLCASCRFFLGTNSGLYLLAGIFGVPTALTNLTPLVTAYSQFPNGISIPKLLRDSQGDLLRLPDCFDGEACDLRYANEFDERAIANVDNSESEVAELVTEMMDRLDGCLAYSDDDELLQGYFSRLLRPNHYCFGATARIGRDFLRRHRSLLAPETKAARLDA